MTSTYLEYLYSKYSFVLNKYFYTEVNIFLTVSVGCHIFMAILDLKCIQTTQNKLPICSMKTCTCFSSRGKFHDMCTDDSLGCFTCQWVGW